MNQRKSKKMKKVFLNLSILALFMLSPPFLNLAVSQEIDTSAKLFVGGGALPETMYEEFLKVTGPETKLVVVPTASSREVDEDKIVKTWKARGFKYISILHTRDRAVASTPEFSASLKTATAVWFNGGSQIRIADAYLGTPVEEEFHKVIERGGVIGGSSAGAAIMCKVMIIGGKKTPKIATGMEFFDGVILDQHFLKRNRLSRLIEAVRLYPDLVGYGIDEGTAIVVYGNEYKIVGESYVIRVQMVDGEIKIDAFENGDVLDW